MTSGDPSEASSGAPGAGERPPLVGLTGGIAAGKSEALAALERIGAAVLSTDAVVHELLGTDELRALVVERLGPEVAPDGRLDRDAIGRAVFADPELRGWLEGLLWPRVGRRVGEWYSEVSERSPPPRAAVVEVPLLFESGMEQVFDRTIAVVADEAVRRERASARAHEGTEERTSRQLAQDEKARRADHVVRNDGTIADLQEALSNVLATIGR